MHLNVLETNEMEMTAPSEPGSAAKNLTVWLVDDRVDLREMMARLLELHGGFRCTRQFSAPDALLSFLARHEGPDILLLDIQMGTTMGWMPCVPSKHSPGPLGSLC